MKRNLIYLLSLVLILTSCQDKLDESYEYEAVKTELAIEQTSLSFDASEQTQRIRVISNSYWTATTNANWIYVENSKAKGNGSLAVSVGANTSVTEERKGVVSVTDGINTYTINVIQDRSAAVISVAKNSIDFSYSGGSSAISVESNVDWKATTDANWCTLSKTSSSGFTVTVQTNNSYLPRSAKISVKNSSVSNSPVITVSQGAPKEPTVSNLTVSDITKTTATCKFTFNSSDLSVIRCGVLYGLTENSLTNKIVASKSSYSGTGSFSLSGLTQNTTYYVCPYVETSVGTTYGSTVQFTTAKIISPNESDNPTPVY